MNDLWAVWLAQGLWDSDHKESDLTGYFTKKSELKLVIFENPRDDYYVLHTLNTDTQFCGYPGSV